MTALGDKRRLKIGQFGYSLDIIALNKRGPCYFDGVRYDVKAGSDIRKWAEVVVITLLPEPTVIETWSVFPLSYGLDAGGFKAVSEGFPLPTTETYTQDDYTSIAFTATEVEYLIGTDAHASDILSTPSTFEARQLLIYATEDVLIRFNDSKRVQHLFFATTYYTIPRRVTKVYVQRNTADGTLYLWSFG